MKMLIALIVLMAVPHAGAQLTCGELFRSRVVTVEEKELHAVIGELQAVLAAKSGPDADKEIDRILRGDVTKTLMDMTNQMRADDRLIDDLLQGRRNLKNSAALLQLSTSLEQYRSLKAGEKKLAVIMGRLLPAREKKREDELRALIPRQSALIQGVKAEIDLDIELMRNIRATTVVHIDALEQRILLLETLEKRLETIVPGQSVLGQALMSRMRYEILNHIQDLKLMVATAKGSVSDIDLVSARSKGLSDDIQQQLTVVLPRVAVVTQTPSLMSSLESGAQAAALVRASSENGAIRAYGSHEDFDRLSALVLSATDINIAQSALAEVIKRQLVTLPPMLVKAFSEKKNGVALINRFLEAGRNETWTISMIDVHTVLLNRLFQTKSVGDSVFENLVAYGEGHPFDAHQNEFLLGAFLNHSLPETARRAAAFILLAHPQPATLEILSQGLRNEANSKFVSEIQARIEKAQQSVTSPQLVDSLQRHLERAQVAQEDAKAEENLARLKEVLKSVREEIGSKDWFEKWFHLKKAIETNPHSERGNVVAEMAVALATQKRSTFYNYRTVEKLNLLGQVLDETVNDLELKASNQTLEDIRGWLRDYKDESRLFGVKILLDLVTRGHVDGLRELIDERIAERPANVFQIILMNARLMIDHREGADALSPMYQDRMRAVVANDENFTGHSEDRRLQVSIVRSLVCSLALTNPSEVFAALSRLRPSPSERDLDGPTMNRIEQSLRKFPEDQIQDLLRKNLSTFNDFRFDFELALRFELREAVEKLRTADPNLSRVSYLRKIWNSRRADAASRLSLQPRNHN